MSLLKTLQKPGHVAKRDLYWKMLFKNQKAMRSGPWKYLSVEGDEFLYDLSKDERERANYGKREPRRLAEMREKYLAWEEALPKHPDATYSMVATKADIVTPSS